MEQESRYPGSHRVHVASERVQTIWRERPSVLQRIALVILGLVLLGLLIIVGLVALVVGGAAILILSVVMLIQRGIERLRGGQASGDTMRRNVRVIRRENQS